MNFILILLLLIIIIIYLSPRKENYNTKNFITFSYLGNNGDFGNQLFQIAATLGLAHRYNLDPIFPEWKYINYFPNAKQLNFNSNLNLSSVHNLVENKSSYENIVLNTDTSYNLLGYRQCELYFKNIKNDIIKLFRPSSEYITKIISEFPQIKNNTISLHVRRGDYVGLSHLYVPLSEQYYLSAYNYIKNIIGNNVNLIIVTNDKEWCRQNLNIINNLPNVYYSPFTSQLDDFTTIYLCKYHIIANSTFSWWAAYLSQSNIVIAPYNWYHGSYSDKNTLDLYPENWILMNNDGKIINRTLIRPNSKFTTLGSTSDRPGNINTLIVSCIYKVNSKRSFDNYLVWFRNFLELKCNKFIFTDTNTFNLLLQVIQPEYRNNLYYINKDGWYCYIKIQDINDTYIAKKYGVYMKECEKMDSELYIGHNSDLYTLWNNKPFFMLDAINTLTISNYVKNIDYCFWVDIGVIREYNNVDVANKLRNTIFMPPELLPKKFLFSFIEKEQTGDNIRYNKDNKILNMFAGKTSINVIRLEGGFFGGNVQHLKVYSKLIDDMIVSYKQYNLFVGKEQNIMYNVYLNNRNFFEEFYPASVTTKLNIGVLDNDWFKFVDYYTVNF